MENNSVNKSLKGLPLVILGIIIYLIFMDFRVGVLILFTLAVHEGCHALAMKYFGHEIKKFFFLPFLGAAVQSKSHVRNSYEGFMIAAMGPIGGLLSALLSFGIFLFCRNYSIAYDGLIFYQYSVYALIINGFNLFPLFPLDGGHMAFHLLINKNSKGIHFYALIVLGIMSLIPMTFLIIKSGNKFYQYFLIGLFTSGMQTILKAKHLSQSYNVVESESEDIIKMERENEKNKEQDIKIISNVLPILKAALSSSLKGKVTPVSLVSILSIGVITFITAGFSSRGMSVSKEKWVKYIQESAYGKSITFEKLNYTFHENLDHPALKQLVSMWEINCDKYTDEACRYMSYVSKMKGQHEKAQSFMQIACLNKKDFAACSEILNGGSKDIGTLALESLNVGCDEKKVEACKILLSYGEYSSNGNIDASVLKEKLCVLGEEYYCARFASPSSNRKPASDNSY